LIALALTHLLVLSGRIAHLFCCYLRTLEQDENLYPIEEQSDEQHEQQLLQQQAFGQARQPLPEQQQLQQRPIPAAASSRGRPGSAAGTSPSSKQQQKQKQQQREQAWQSEPFMPAPANLLRRKRSGVAEAWDVAAAAAAARAQRQSGENRLPCTCSSRYNYPNSSCSGCLLQFAL
jgi:hypothetical protein